MDAAGERRGRGQAGRRVRASRRRLAAGRGGRRVRQRRSWRGPRRARVPRALRGSARAGRDPTPRHPVGRGCARRGHRDRPHRPGRGRRGLRALARARLGRADADRRVRPFPAGLRALRGALDRRGGRADRGGARRARRARRSGQDRPPLPDLLALQDAARLPRRRRLVHPHRGPAPAAARRQRRGRVDAAELQEADGRLAAQHGRLEHLAQALLRAAAAVLSVRVRPAERDRLARRARGARDRRPRPAAGAAPAVDRRGADPLLVLQRGGAPDPGGRRRVARRGHRPALDARLGERRAGRARLRHRRGQGADRRGSPRPRVLGALVPGRLDLGEPRADPALVLLDQRDVDDDDGAAAVPLGADLRARPRRDRPRDAQVDRQRDRGERGLRADGRRHRALAVLRAEPEPEHQLRLRAGRGGEAAAADALELGRLPRHLREHRGLAAEVGRAAVVRARARPLARRPHRAARGRGRVRVRAQLDSRRDDCVRELRRGSLQLVHPPVSTPVLGRRARGARDALVVARPVAAGGRAADAVLRRPPLARAGAGRPGLRAPGRLARSRSGGRDAARRDGRGAPCGHSSATRRARSRA